MPVVGQPDVPPVRAGLGRSAKRVLATAIAVVGVLASLRFPSAASAGATRATVVHTKAENAAIVAVGRLMNTERRANGLAPVHANSLLVLSARRHNLQMARFDVMSHQLPGEAFFANRMTAAGYHWTWAGENIGWNSDMSTAGVIALERLMYAEKPPDDGHRQNILGRHFQDVGIDVYFDYAHHKVWFTTDFGHH